jgi:hypothetical protein
MHVQFYYISSIHRGIPRKGVFLFPYPSYRGVKVYHKINTVTGLPLTTLLHLIRFYTPPMEKQDRDLYPPFLT